MSSLPEGPDEKRREELIQAFVKKEEKKQDAERFVEEFLQTEYYKMGCVDRIAVGAATGAFSGFMFGNFNILWYPDGKLLVGKKVVDDTFRIKNVWTYNAMQYARPVALGVIVTSTFAGVECLMEEVRGVGGKASPWWNVGTAGGVAGIMMGSLVGGSQAMALSGTGMFALFSGLGLAQYLASKPKVAERKAEMVNTVTEYTLKEKYPEYKDV